MMVLVKKWLPGEELNELSMGEAMFLEKNYWKNMADAVAQGIAKVL